MKELFEKARSTSYKLMNLNTRVKNEALAAIARKLDENRELIKSENEKDLKAGLEAGLSSALIDRLRLDDKAIDSMIKAVNEIKEQTDPVGSVVDGYKRPNGLYITKVRVPLGVVGIIYESRPNVTVDAAALCLKSGNVSILRGGKEAIHSNTCLGKIMAEALAEAGLPEGTVNVVPDTDRFRVTEMLQAKGYIDIIIPRGGSELIKFCSENAHVPLVKHDAGICHVYVDKDADIQKALKIVRNAKVQRPGVCNAAETLLVHEDAAGAFLPVFAELTQKDGLELRGCGRTLAFIDVKPAADEDWSTEYLDLILSVKVVSSMEEALAHINRYGSGHSEAIITENYTSARQFMDRADASAVFVNASTRFNDGGEFGLGAEIGISTQKLHCRGPMGAFDLTTTKYQVYGDGHIRE
ncbi:glutamate-5-semialdehyde dehydrogenase [Geovibrio thiophilus]|uniref:Gamma-glutamyl phosphate reductase n=1 Tax=Geovibrio thiophilus TaxID=139438 RepID=A0A3R5XXD0_9BACT|nr:glutamate-5-semialdehyde dehydrogenase [Geovibrio thiophilus]QAR33560.1 glutamate-5-semialdehyde dehydrogenase [Geovibrio thiophilus]